MEYDTTLDKEPKSTAIHHRLAVDEGVRVTELVQRSVGGKGEFFSFGEYSGQLAQMVGYANRKYDNTLRHVHGCAVIQSANPDDPRRRVIVARQNGYNAYSMTLDSSGAGFSVTEGGHEGITRAQSRAILPHLEPGMRVTYGVQGVADRLYLDDSQRHELPPEVAEFDMMMEAAKAHKAAESERRSRSKGSRALRFFGRAQ